MTAFLFIPPTVDATGGRRLDVAGYAGLFSHCEDQPARPPRGHGAAWSRFAAAALFALIAMGDMVLLAKPAADLAPATARAPAKPVTL